MTLPTCAILIMDMAGFSALCERVSIHAARAEVQRFHDLGRACVASHGGEFVSVWADNFMASFATVRQAQGVAETMVALVPCSAGIGYGPVLEEPGDLWGVEVNRASRLGEDVAKAGEILLTDAAKAA